MREEGIFGETGPPPLRPGRAHEVCGAAACAFAAAQAALRQGPLLWILAPPGRGGAARSGSAERPDPYGLAAFLDPGRLILVETVREEEVFWAMEEGLRSGAAPFVIAEAPRRGPLASPDLTRSRRLQLAAEAGGATGLLTLSGPETARANNAAETRWRAEPAPAWSRKRAAGGPVWEWRLLKNKRGRLGCWRVRWIGGGAKTGAGTGEAAARKTAKNATKHTAGDREATGDAHDHGSPQEGPAHPLALVAEGGGGGRAAA